MPSLGEIEAYCNGLLSVGDFADYSPNGLQVDAGEQVGNLVSGVTASLALIEAAAEAGADTLLVHHGYFWKGEPPSLVGIRGRRVRALLAHGISLLAYHLPLDAHRELGNNRQLAGRLGIVCELPAEGQRAPVWRGVPAESFDGAALAGHITTRLGREPLHIPGKASLIRSIAWCTGAGQGFIEQAIAMGVDAYLTGEVSEPTVHLARESGIHFYAAGHHATERYGVQSLGAHLAGRFGLAHSFIDIDNPV